MCNRRDNNLEINSVRSSLDLGNKTLMENDLSTQFFTSKTPSRFFIFAIRKLWKHLVEVFLVGFWSFLLCNYTSLPKSSNLPLIPNTNISENTDILWYTSKSNRPEDLGKKYHEEKWEVQSKVHFVWNIQLILIEIYNIFRSKLNSLLLIWVILHNFILSGASLPFWI